MRTKIVESLLGEEYGHEEMVGNMSFDKKAQARKKVAKELPALKAAYNSLHQVLYILSGTVEHLEVVEGGMDLILAVKKSAKELTRIQDEIATLYKNSEKLSKALGSA